jgi:glycosyltransferase involved in cell wall biosynthesis
MKLLAVVPYYKPAYQFGGPVKSVSALCEGLAEIGVDVTVFTTRAGCEGLSSVPSGDGLSEEFGVKVRRFPVSRHAPQTYYYSPALAREIESAISQFDVAYFSATWTHPFLCGARSALSAGVPYVASPRGSFMKWSLRQKWLKKKLYWSAFEKRLISNCYSLHCTTHLERRQSAEFVCSAPIATIPNPIDESSFDLVPHGGRARQRLGIRENDLLSVFAGRLHPMKRLEFIITAFAQVSRRVSGAYLAIAGGDDGAELSARATALTMGVGERVFFLGQLGRSELAELYRDANVSLLLSHRENFGMVVAEAMAASVPVLVNEKVGLSDEVRVSRSGFVVSDNLEENVSSWCSLLVHPERRQMGERGRAYALANFSKPGIARQMEHLFQEAMASRADRLSAEAV